MEVYYSDGNVLQLKCEEIEASLRTIEQLLAKLQDVWYDCSRLFDAGIQ